MALHTILVTSFVITGTCVCLFGYLRVFKISEPSVYCYFHYFIDSYLWIHKPLTPEDTYHLPRLALWERQTIVKSIHHLQGAHNIVNGARLAYVEYLRNNVLREYIQKLYLRYQKV